MRRLATTGDTEPPTIATSTTYGLEWVARAPMPTPRDRLGLAVAGGKLFAIGGSSLSAGSGQALDTVEAYDPATNTWAARRPMPTARFNIGAVTAPNGKIYVFGSWQQVEEYDPATDQWATRAPMPTARFGPGVALASNGRIYVVGGGAGPIAFGTVEEYDPLSNTWATRRPMPTPRYNLGVVAAGNGKIYAVGGLMGSDANGNSCCPTSVVEEYDPATDTWVGKAPAPAAFGFGGLVAAPNGRVYAVGLGGGFQASYEYDPATDSWQPLEGLPARRAGIGAALGDDGRIYAIGGFGPVGDNEASAIEVRSGESPAPGAVGVSVTSKVIIRFSEEVVLSGADYGAAGKVRLLRGGTLVPASGSYSSGQRLYTVTPFSGLAVGTSYTVLVKGGAAGVTDLAGNAMAADFTGSFSTEPPPAAPLPPPAKQLVVSAPSPLSPIEGQPFSVAFQVQNANGVATPVSQPTEVRLSVKTGVGVLGGPVTTTIPAGYTSWAFGGVTYAPAEPGVALTAASISGDQLISGDTPAFTVQTPAPVPTVLAVNSAHDGFDAAPGDTICATPEGLCTLRAAIQEGHALPGRQTIAVPTGQFGLTLGPLDLWGDVTIVGAGAESTYIDGLDNTRVFSVHAGIVELGRLAIQNGRWRAGSAGPIGAGIRNEELGNLTLTDVAVKNNHNEDSNGGGIRNLGTLTLNRTSVTGNTARAGAGISNSGTLTVTDSLFSDNRTTVNSGGAIDNKGGGTTTITRTSVLRNHSATNGGGLRNRSTMYVHDSLIRDNTAANHGGGIQNSSDSSDSPVPATLEVWNTTISGNSATNNGGGLDSQRVTGETSFGSSLVAVHVTLHGNTAATGGAVRNQSASTVRLRSTIVSGGCSGTLVSDGYNLDSGTTCGLNGTGDLNGVDPLLSPLGPGGGPTETHALQPGSPAIDAGGNCPPPATDQRGVVRPLDGNGDGVAVCDIGAHEARWVPATITVNTTQDGPDAAVGDGICATPSGLCTLRAALQEAETLPGLQTIVLPAGAFSLGHEITLIGDLALQGAGLDSTTIDGLQGSRVLRVTSGSVIISQLTIQNGFIGSVGGPGTANSPGAGLRVNQGARAFLNDVRIRDNRTEGSGGGGIRNDGEVTLTRVSILNNVGTSGGGIANTGILTVVSSTFSGNSALTGSGGGINNGQSNGAGVLTVSDSIFTENIAGNSGGAIANGNGSTASLHRATITNNRATGNGGGIRNNSTMHVYDSLIAFNETMDRGGGAHNSSNSSNSAVPAVLELTNSTVTGNTAANSGGGISNQRNATETAFMSQVTLVHVTLHQNNAPSGPALSNQSPNTVRLRGSIVSGACSGAILSDGYNMDAGATCALTGTGDVSNADPRLGTLAGNGGPTQTHALLAGSPAIDAAGACPPPAMDQRGTDRPLDGNGDGVVRCDIGAYEAPTVTNPDIDGDGIRNSVDRLPLTAMTCSPTGCTDGGFSDGTTSGTVQSKDAGLTLTIEDHPDTTRGVRVTASGSGQAVLKLDGNEATYVFDAGDQGDLTTGSAILAVTSGSVLVLLPSLSTQVTVAPDQTVRLVEADSGVTVTAVAGAPVLQVTDRSTVVEVSLSGGETVQIVQPATGPEVTITAVAGTPTVTVNGQTADLSPGQSLSTDGTAPTTTAGANPAANAGGWHRTGVTVTLAAVDAAPGGAPAGTHLVSGVREIRYSLNGGGEVVTAAVSVEVQVTGEGTHTITYYAVDNAGNRETRRTLTVRIDRTSPEASLQLDLSRGDIQVTGRDGGSGTAPGPVAPASVAPAPLDVDDDPATRAELRTYVLNDLAGNRLTLAVKVKRLPKDLGGRVKAEVISVRYENGGEMTMPANRMVFDWWYESPGALRAVEQSIDVGRDVNGLWIRAGYDAVKHQTVIEVKRPEGQPAVTRPGIALLRLATDKGRLVVEHP